MRCLITGATGFVGGHLAAHLLEAGHEVTGLTRGRQSSSPPAKGGPGGVAPARPLSPIPLHPVDWQDTAPLTELLRQLQPDWVFHLAGYANAGKSFKEPELAWAGNLTATQSLYAALEACGSRARVLFVSSGLVYGDATAGFPVCTEAQPLRPVSPYAASKAAADVLSYQVTRHPGLDVVTVRPFNHLGPGQPADYAASNFARQLAAAEAGRQPPVIRTGDLSSTRDFTDVRDMVRAYALLMEKGKTGEAYNAGTGETHTMRDVLDLLRKLARVTVDVTEEADPARPADPVISGVSNAKLVQATGWRPAYSLDRTLGDVLDDWRNNQ